MRSVVLAVAISSVATVFPVAAQETGFYIGGELGLAASTGMDLTFTPGATAGTVGRLDVDHKPGFNGSMLAGYDFGRLRIEAEASRLRAGIDGASSDWSQASGLVAGKQDLDGDVGASSLLLNLIVDFGGPEGVPPACPQAWELMPWMAPVPAHARVWCVDFTREVALSSPRAATSTA